MGSCVKCFSISKLKLVAVSKASRFSNFEKVKIFEKEKILGL